MAGTARKRNDPRREATRAALIEAAESLIAQHGYEGVSTRQIGAAIGSANTNVVAYHFGSKDALVEAIYRHRLPQIDQRRGELLGAVPSGDLFDLIRIFALPLFEQTDAQGHHSFARFLAAMERSGALATRGALIGEFPETERLMQAIAARVPVDDRKVFHARLRMAIALILAGLAMIDREAPGAAGEALFETSIQMAAAALAAPAQQETTSP